MTISQKQLHNRLVSIIIPTYNGQKWVCGAIDCSLNQTYQNCEVIVIDDGSTDNTRILLQDKYGDKIQYVYQQNRGPASARNTGIHRANGKYIQFLDADDLILPDKIRVQVTEMSDMASPSVSYTDYYFCNIDNNRLALSRMTPVMDLENPLMEIAMHWETRMSIPVHCFLFDVEFFKKHGILFDENLPNHEDWDCWMHVFALKPSIQFINQKMAAYRIRTNSLCRDRQEMRQGFLTAIAKQKKILDQNKKIQKILTDKEKEVCTFYDDEVFWARPFSRLPLKFMKILARIISKCIHLIFY